MNEASRALRWLYAQLTPLSAPVYRGIAPGGTQTPYIIINWQGGNDQSEVNGHRILNSSLYQVKAIGESAKYNAIEALAERIDTAIHRNSGTAGIGSTIDSEILFCDREQNMIMDFDVNSEAWVSCGGLYRILVSPLIPA